MYMTRKWTYGIYGDYKSYETYGKIGNYEITGTYYGFGFQLATAPQVVTWTQKPATGWRGSVVIMSL